MRCVRQGGRRHVSALCGCPGSKHQCPVEEQLPVCIPGKPRKPHVRINRHRGFSIRMTNRWISPRMLPQNCPTIRQGVRQDLCDTTTSRVSSFLTRGDLSAVKSAWSTYQPIEHLASPLSRLDVLRDLASRRKPLGGRRASRHIRGRGDPTAGAARRVDVSHSCMEWIVSRDCWPGLDGLKVLQLSRRVSSPLLELFRRG